MSTPIAEKVTGQVKWFNTKTGYGFITVLDDGDFKSSDIFAHYSNLRITHSQYKYLVQGEYVEFDMVKPAEGSHEYHAVNVSGIRGGNIMCEIRHAAEKEREKRSGDAGDHADESSDWQQTPRRRPAGRKPVARS
uniref:CSD domain-containing protein n=1 Tax=viral metagenome TaxID=1070528 RepID=A0A6C0C0S3_9ZZZZ